MPSQPAAATRPGHGFAVSDRMLFGRFDQVFVETRGEFGIHG
jgi:hypothetical protein